MCDRVEVELLAFCMSLPFGIFFTVWPETPAKFDIRLRFWFESQEKRAAFLRGFGYIILCFSGASLLAALIDLLFSC